MFASQTEGVRLLLFSLVVGASLGLVYDLVRLLLHSFVPKHRFLNQNEPTILTKRSLDLILYGKGRGIHLSGVVEAVFDVLFFVISAVAVIILLFHLNYGRVRVFSLVSAFTGYTVYRSTIGKAVTFALGKTALLIKKLLKILLYPIVQTFKKLVSPIAVRLQEKIRKKRVVSILERMRQNEIKRIVKRKSKNERNKGGADYEQSQRAVFKG